MTQTKLYTALTVSALKLSCENSQLITIETQGWYAGDKVNTDSS